MYNLCNTNKYYVIHIGMFHSAKTIALSDQVGVCVSDGWFKPQRPKYPYSGEKVIKRGVGASVQSLDRLDCQGDVRDDSAEILFSLSFLWEASVNSSSFGRDVHSSTLSIPFFLGDDPPGLLRLRGFSLKIACVYSAGIYMLFLTYPWHRKNWNVDLSVLQIFSIFLSCWAEMAES